MTTRYVLQPLSPSSSKTEYNHIPTIWGGGLPSNSDAQPSSVPTPPPTSTLFLASGYPSAFTPPLPENTSRSHKSTFTAIGPTSMKLQRCWPGRTRQLCFPCEFNGWWDVTATIFEAQVG
jgi:hypothetical protein